MMPPIQTILAADPAARLASRDTVFQKNASDMLADKLQLSPRKAPRADSLVGRAAPLRVMVVGDSMTQGREGDWTWRYRIWQFFQHNQIAVDFVGPYIGTAGPQAPEAPTPPPL